MFVTLFVPRESYFNLTFLQTFLVKRDNKFTLVFLHEQNYNFLKAQSLLITKCKTNYSTHAVIEGEKCVFSVKLGYK